MNKLPGLGYLRMLPLTCLVRSQLFRSSFAQMLSTQHSITQGPVSILLSTYRTVRYRLMRKISVAAIRRRSKINFFGSRSIADGHANNEGHISLPVTMPKPEAPRGIIQGHALRTLTNSNFWASLQSSRTYATMSERWDKNLSSKRSKSSVERPLVPIFSFAKYPEVEVKTTRSNSAQANAKLLVKENVREREKTVDRNLTILPPKREFKKKLFTPTLPIMRVVSKKEQLAKAQTARKDLAKVRAFPGIRFDAESSAKSSVNTVRHISAVPCQTILQKFAAPEMTFLKATNRAPRYLETYESRLRAMRQAQPLNLKMPPKDQDQLTLNKLYHANKSHQLGNKYGMTFKHRRSTLSLPSLKCSKMALPYRTAQNRNAAYQTNTSRAPNTADEAPAKPAGVHKLPEKTAKHAEQEGLNNLLGDLLAKKPRNPCVQNIQFNKVAPLCRLVTNSMEGRSELHKGTFKKQLEVPQLYKQLYKQPTIRNYRQPMARERRSISMGQSSLKTNKSLIDGKLSLLLNSEEDDEDYDDEPDA